LPPYGLLCSACAAAECRCLGPEAYRAAELTARAVRSQQLEQAVQDQRTQRLAELARRPGI
jgi:hypothetical protein